MGQCVIATTGPPPPAADVCLRQFSLTAILMFERDLRGTTYTTLVIERDEAGRKQHEEIPGRQISDRYGCGLRVDLPAPSPTVAKEFAMRKPQIWRVGLLITLVAVLNTEMVLAQPTDTPIGTLPLPHEAMAIVHHRSIVCGPATRLEFQQDSDEPRGEVDGLMVAEDMRCRQCHGKCSADSLRCRSQCAGDGPCLVHCEERTRNCEALCKQIFQCE